MFCGKVSEFNLYTVRTEKNPPLWKLCWPPKKLMEIYTQILLIALFLWPAVITCLTHSQCTVWYHSNNTCCWRYVVMPHWWKITLPLVKWTTDGLLKKNNKKKINVEHSLCYGCFKIFLWLQRRKNKLHKPSKRAFLVVQYKMVQRKQTRFMVCTTTTQTSWT